MSKTLKAAIAASILVTPALAAPTNMENPLYLPTAGTFYSKTMLGIMHKAIDDTAAQVASGHNTEHEFPIYRVSEELGYGITDHLTVLGQVGYTYNGDIDRKGLHLGRLGLNYRIFDGCCDASPVVWDVYADAHLGGISKMTGKYTMVSPTAAGFVYDNYSTGQYGVYVGTKLGHKWDKFTGMMFAEMGYFFPGDNTEIDVMLPSAAVDPALAAIPGAVVGTAVADMKSFIDWNIGAKFSYEFEDAWTLGWGIAWKHHSNHKIDSAKLDISELPAAFGGMGLTPDVVANGMATAFAGRDLKDTFDEFPITVSIARGLTDATQVALYGEYTFDDGDEGSQNSTDVKWELGVRFNAQF